MPCAPAACEQRALPARRDGTGRDGTGRDGCSAARLPRASPSPSSASRPMLRGSRFIEPARKLCLFTTRPSVALGLEETTNTRNPEPCRRDAGGEREAEQWSRRAAHAARRQPGPAQRRRPHAVPRARLRREAVLAGGAATSRRPQCVATDPRRGASLRRETPRLSTAAAARRGARPRDASRPPSEPQLRGSSPLSRRALLPPAGLRARCGRPLPLLRAGERARRASPCRAERFAPGKRELHEGCGRPMGPHNAGKLRRAECGQ